VPRHSRRLARFQSMLARGEQLTQYLRCRRGSGLPQRIHVRVVRMKSSRYCCWPQIWSGPQQISARECALAFRGRRGFQRREHCDCLINQTEWKSASNPYFEKRKVKLVGRFIFRSLVLHAFGCVASSAFSGEWAGNAKMHGGK
jgi:hypothetical protein